MVQELLRILHKINRPKFERYSATELIKREDKLSSQMDALTAFTQVMSGFSVLVVVLRFCVFIGEKATHACQRLMDRYLFLGFVFQISFILMVYNFFTSVGANKQ